MSNDVKNYVSNCEQCMKVLPSEPDPEVENCTIAKYPMEYVSTELFEHENKHYLLIIDRFTDFLFVAKLRSLTSEAIVDHMRRWFQDFGYPKCMQSDMVLSIVLII